MALGVDDVLGIASGVLGAANTGYNLYTNKRDFDYQKALQQQIFEREDTAVQRRMKDLEAAGLNPNLAAGSAAGAGSVVARSSTNDVNMGSALDMIQAVNNIRQQRQQTQNLQVEKQILDEKLDEEKNNRLLNYFNTQIGLAETMYQLGLPISVETVHDGKGSFYPQVKLDFQADKGRYSWNTEKPLIQAFDYQLNSMKNSADLLQKDNDWYTADKVSGMALGLLGAGSSVFNWRKTFSKK